MRRGSLISGFEALQRFPRGMNHHVTDVRGRAVYCDCFRWIRVGGVRKLASSNKGVKSAFLTPLYRKIRFERYLDDASYR